MAARIEVGWDHARIGSAIMEIGEEPLGVGDTFYVVADEDGVHYGSTEAGGTSVNTDSAYCHTDLSTVVRGGEYSDFVTAILAALNAGSPNGFTYTASWNGASGYTLDAGASNFQIGFSTLTDTAAGTRMRQILGFSGDVGYGASDKTSDRVPYYTLLSEHGGVTEPSDDQYAAGRSKGAVSMSGQHYAIASTGVVKTYDFKFPYESYEKTFSHQGNGTAPDGSTPVVWKYEDFIDHAKAIEPFVLVTSSESVVMTLRPEGDALLPEREVPNFNEFWTWPFRAYVDGRL